MNSDELQSFINWKLTHCLDRSLIPLRLRSWLPTMMNMFTSSQKMCFPLGAFGVVDNLSSLLSLSVNYCSRFQAQAAMPALSGMYNVQSLRKPFWAVLTVEYFSCLFYLFHWAPGRKTCLMVYQYSISLRAVVWFIFQWQCLQMFLTELHLQLQVLMWQ